MSNRLKVIWEAQPETTTTTTVTDGGGGGGHVLTWLSRAVRTAVGEYSPVLGERVTMIRNSYTITEYGAVALFVGLFVLAVLVTRYRVRRRQQFMEESFGFNKKKKSS